MTLKQKQLKHHKINFCQLVLGILLLTLFYTNALFAAEHHSHEQIRNTAVEFVRSQLPEDVTIKTIKAGKIDSRIHFKQCSQALEASSSISKRITKSWTIGVRCYGDTPWSIYIPVKTILSRKMFVSKTTIIRGEIITPDKITLMEQQISHQNQKHFSILANITGREARRTIRPNRVINSSMLQEALLVRKKESVLIYAKSQTLQVSMKGTALKNGRYNEMIKVRNNSSKKIIDALVTARGIVSVNF
ncbi:MAG: flagellar basal body P-ring formation protein FlgA [Gammaproteobacteria bacterium]|nr:flagellar basal body P-ring formation protein FlgA [Gammaproteobacteria bacterium]